MKKFLLFFNLLTFFVFLVFVALTFLWPEHLLRIGLRGEGGKVVMLQLISLLLLLGGLQTTLTPLWRRLSLGASFLVLAQSTLMSILLPGLDKLPH